jgi:uncharacterized protein
MRASAYGAIRINSMTSGFQSTINRGENIVRILNIISASTIAVSLLASTAGFAQSELTLAVMNGEEELVADLLRREADVNHIEPDNSTALHWAVYHENLEIVEDLVKAGANIDYANREGINPLMLAVQTGNAEITEFLLDSGAKADYTLTNGETPLMMAARTGDTATIQVVLDHGADVNAVENLRGTSALMWAAANRNTDAVQLLINSGATLGMHSKTVNPGRGPYLAPTARTRIRSAYQNTGFGQLSENAAELTDGSPRSREEVLARIPDQLLEAFEREEAARQAQQGEQRPERKQWGGLTALHFAVREGDLASAKALIDAGADVNQVSEFGWTPLLIATQNRFYQLGMYLMEQGANPNIANEGGWNPLYIATDNRNIEGGDYPTRKPDMDHLDYIKALLDAGADPNIRMNSSTETRTIFTHQWLEEPGATPFLRAAQSSDLELMRLLLEKGADPNLATNDGVTPLMVASGIAWVEGVTYEWSEEANIETIKMLIELGNDPNTQDIEDGRTAMMGAAHKGRPEAIQVLVDAGGDLSLRDVGSRDSLHRLLGVQWQAVDYAEGLVRVGVQSAVPQPETAALIRSIMAAKGMEVPPEGRTLESICIVDICK